MAFHIYVSQKTVLANTTESRPYLCPQCRNVTKFWISQQKVESRLFGMITVCKSNAGYCVICQHCGDLHEITKKEFELIRSGGGDLIVNSPGPQRPAMPAFEAMLFRPKRLIDTINRAETHSQFLERVTDGRYRKTRLFCWLFFIASISLIIIPLQFDLSQNIKLATACSGMLMIYVWIFCVIRYIPYMVLRSKTKKFYRKLKKS